MQHFTHFVRTTKLTPVQQELSENCSVQFIHDESGVDWYILQKLFRVDTLKLQYNNAGLVVAADIDASKLFPLECSVVEVVNTDMPDDFRVGQFIYSNGSIIPSSVDHVADAMIERDNRMAVATIQISNLAEAQDDGDITVQEMTELSSLREYRTKLRRLDLTAAPAINWPVPPND